MATDLAIQPDVVQNRLFNVDEYYRMAEAGILAPDERVELLAGYVTKMSPMGSRHAACVSRLNKLLSERLPKSFSARIQSPVRLEPYSEPEPDIAVVNYRDDHYAQGHPSVQDILAIIEVADTSLAKDRDIKVPLYAQAGVPEVWLINLNTNTVTVYRKPQGDKFIEVQTINRGDVVITSVPSLSINADEILT